MATGLVVIQLKEGILSLVDTIALRWSDIRHNRQILLEVGAVALGEIGNVLANGIQMAGNSASGFRSW